MAENVYVNQSARTNNAPKTPEKIYVEGPLLEDVIQGLDRLPPQALLVGVCAEDDLPLLLDLGNPAPGHFLLAGDHA